MHDPASNAIPHRIAGDPVFSSCHYSHRMPSLHCVDAKGSVISDDYVDFAPNMAKLIGKFLYEEIELAEKYSTPEEAPTPKLKARELLQTLVEMIILAWTFETPHPFITTTKKASVARPVIY